MEDIKESVILIGVLIGIIVITVVLCIIINSLKCDARYENSKYTMLGGCMVEYNGKYIPESLYEKAFEQNINIKK